MPDRQPIFDFHTHCFPDAIAARTMETLGDKAGIPYYHDGSYAGLIGYEQEADGFLVLPIATKPSQTRSILQFAASIDGDGKARSLGSVHPFDPDYRMWLDLIVSSGFKGVKLHPEYQDFFVDDERLLGFYRDVFDRGLLLALHAGSDLGFDNPIHGDPERIAWLCDRFPDARVVAAHMGGYDRWERVSKHLAGRRNLWLDTSFAAGVMPDGDFAALARKHGPDRILFGTDSPWRPFDKTLDALLNVGFSPAELRGILCDNAMELLV